MLNENYYMWSDGGMKSRLKSYLGSRSLRGRIDIVEKEHYPIFFRESFPSAFADAEKNVNTRKKDVTAKIVADIDWCFYKN